MGYQTKLGVDHHFLVVRTTTEGSGDHTTMRIRRVVPPGDHTPEHVQVEFTSVRKGLKRDITSHGYVQLRPEDVEVVIKALTQPVPNDHLTPMAEVERETARTLGIESAPPEQDGAHGHRDELPRPM